MLSSLIFEQKIKHFGIELTEGDEHWGENIQSCLVVVLSFLVFQTEFEYNEPLMSLVSCWPFFTKKNFP
jgi:hypothetical protein